MAPKKKVQVRAQLEHYDWLDDPMTGEHAGRARVRATVTWGPLVAKAPGGTQPPMHVVVEVTADGRVTRLEIDDPAGITTRRLRDLPLSELRMAARKALAREMERHGEPSLRIPPRVRARAARSFREVRRPGRRGRDIFEYLTIAEDYLRLVDEVDNPVQVLAERYGLTPSQAPQLLYRLRRPPLDLLKPLGRGLPGGELTEKAKALQRERKEMGR
jgi:hypothetical protein